MFLYASTTDRKYLFMAARLSRTSERYSNRISAYWAMVLIDVPPVMVPTL